MKLLFEVASQDAAGILVPLANACDRAGVSWGCFFTGDGVLSLSSEDLASVLKKGASAIACEASWEILMGDTSCPVSLGSQTNNCELVGDVDKLISL